MKVGRILEKPFRTRYGHDDDMLRGYYIIRFVDPHDFVTAVNVIAPQAIALCIYDMLPDQHLEALWETGLGDAYAKEVRHEGW